MHDQGMLMTFAAGLAGAFLPGFLAHRLTPFAALAAETNRRMTMSEAFELVRALFLNLEVRREHDS